MRNINTMISYSLRFIVALHAVVLGLLFIFEKPQTRTTTSVLIFTIVLVFIIPTLLIADWATPKVQTRRFPKLVDSIIGIGWLLTIAVAVLRSLSMGTL